MDRRKKRTSTNQYSMYIDLMEKDAIFATGRVPRDADVNYLQKRWKELSDKLNTCGSGPTLTAEEWRKRLNDWKNTTRCKYRRSLSGEKDISLTSLESKALELFGKAPNVSTSSSDQVSLHLKSEKEDDDEMDEQRTLQKELQAAVEEAIGGNDEEEDDEEMADEQDEHSEMLPNTLAPNVPHLRSSVGDGVTTYRTIMVENAAQYPEEDNHDEQLEFITHRRATLGAPQTSAGSSSVAAAVQTVVSGAPTGTTVTKLINGDIPLKRLRSQVHEQIVYEVKKTPLSQQHTQRNITLHNTAAPTQHHQQQLHHHQQQQHHHQSDGSSMLSSSVQMSSPDAREIARQLKRLADIKSEKLKFEIARFKFNNPGFNFSYPPPL